MPLTERPPCSCHSEPQRWNTDKRYRGGGYWRCAVKDRTQTARYKRERGDRDPLWRIAREDQTHRLQRRLRRRASRGDLPVDARLADALRFVKRQRS